MLSVDMDAQDFDMEGQNVGAQHVDMDAECEDTGRELLIRYVELPEGVAQRLSNNCPLTCSLEQEFFRDLKQKTSFSVVDFLSCCPFIHLF